MTTTVPCQAPFQHKMCFVRTLTKLGGKDVLISYSPNVFHKKSPETCFLYKWILVL